MDSPWYYRYTGDIGKTIEQFDKHSIETVIKVMDEQGIK
jgi:hypothetical protein